MSQLNYNAIDIQLLAIILTFILFISVIAKKSILDKASQAYLLLCLSTVIMLIADLIPWLIDGQPGRNVRTLCLIFQSLYFALLPLVASVFLCYIDLMLFDSMERLKRRFYYLTPLLISVPLSLLSLKNGFIFTLDPNNFYIRGPGVLLITLIGWIPMSYILVLTIANRKKMDTRTIAVIGSFVLIPALGNILQFIFIGTSIIWPSTSIALLILYVFLEIRKEHKDYLTGLLSRQQIDNWIFNRTNQFSKLGSFSLIVIDINKFKHINDTYGHQEGDLVLVHFSRLLSQMSDTRVMVGRFGGDEFIIVVDDVDFEKLNILMNNLYDQLEKESIKLKLPYNLSFSCGYAVYNPDKHKSLAKLFAEADKNMYLAKQKNMNGLLSL